MAAGLPLTKHVRLAGVSLAGLVYSHQIAHEHHQQEYAYLLGALQRHSGQFPLGADEVRVSPARDSWIVGLDYASIHEALSLSSYLSGRERWWKNSRVGGVDSFLEDLGCVPPFCHPCGV